MSTGQENSLTVIAGSTRGSLLHAPDMYMKKIAVGPKAKGSIDINASLTENMKTVAKALNKEVTELTVMIQNRERHQDLIDEVLALGASIKLFPDVDISGAIATAMDEIQVDMLVGTGGAPEGVITAVALKCLGGDFQAKLVPQNEEEIKRCLEMGIAEPEKKLTIDEIVRSDECFFVATGITDGLLLKGIEKKKNGVLKSDSFVAIGGEVKNYQSIQAHH